MSGIDSDLIRGHIDTIILKTLFDGDKYGYEILDDVAKKSRGLYELKQPTLYSCLKRLESQGLISSYWVDSEIGGKRHYYKLTDLGIETYKNNQSDWLRSRQIIDNLIWEEIPEDNNVDYNVDNLTVKEPVADDKEQSTAPSDHANDETGSAQIIAWENDNTKTLGSEKTSSPDTTPLPDIDESVNKQYVLWNDENKQEEPSSNQNTDDDIMALLGHYSHEDNQVDNKIKELEENAAENEAASSYLGNAFLEQFAKNYLASSTEETNLEDEAKTQENNSQELVDDYNLDIESYLNNKSFFDSNAETENYVEPYSKIDGLENQTSENIEKKTEANQVETENVDYYSSSEPSNNLFESEETTHETDAFEDNSDLTPSYLSFGEEINRNTQEADLTQNTSFDEQTTEETQQNEYESSLDNNEMFDYSTSAFDDETNIALENASESTEEPLELQTREKNEIATQDNQTKYAKLYESEPNYKVLHPLYTDTYHKEKLQELTTLAKVSEIQEEAQEEPKEDKAFDAQDFLKKNQEKANYDKLISEFKKQGLEVRVHTKLVKESKNTKTYVQTNKIKMVRNWISFSLIVALLAATFAIMNNNAAAHYNFSVKYFIIGLAVALIVPATSTIIYALNPYKKHIASYNSSVSILLSALIFVQLLLIIYCVNLQLGFFSFAQEYYNHLFWIIPMIVSLYPLLNAIIYATLYKSKNFHT